MNLFKTVEENLNKDVDSAETTPEDLTVVNRQT